MQNGLPDIMPYLASHVCASCASRILKIESPICTRCGMMFGEREGEDHLCGNCIRQPKRYRKARACYVYQDVGLDLIHAYKYRGKVQLARPLGALMRDTYRRYWREDEIDEVTPVPLHSSRLRVRGFNQAYLLAKSGFGSEPPGKDGSGLPAASMVDHPLLVRRKMPGTQTGSGRSQRAENVRRAFTVPKPSVVEGKRVLIVDDVYTTGSTVDACAGVLMASGAAFVDVLTLARAM